MQLTEQIRINAPRERVFAALNDVDILRQAIPGCEAIDAASPTEMTATVSAKVGPLKARFSGQVTLADLVPPESYTLSGEGKGGPAGHVRVSSRVKLTADGAATLLDYDVKADIGGKLAQLGGAIVEKTARKLAGEFFASFNALVGVPESAAEVPPAATPAPVETSASHGHGHGGEHLPWVLGGALAVLVIVWLTR